MAYSRGQIIQIGDQLGRAYQRAEVEILEELLSAQTSDWRQAYLEQRLDQIRGILEELGETEADWRQTHLRKLYQSGIDEADKHLTRAAGVKPPPRELASVHRESIRIIAEEMRINLDAARSTVGRQVEDVFRKGALGAIQAETARGGTALDAAKRMIDTWERKGVTAFTDSAGKRWNLNTYARMVARTTTREATDQALWNRLEEREHDLVRITRHAGECPKCEEALDTLGTIFSLSGNHPKYPALDEAEDMDLFHPNCIHRQIPHIERYAA